MDDERDIILREDKHNLAAYAKQDQLAYVMYTSGSMGRAKGVMITQENVCHYTGAMCATLGRDCRRSISAFGFFRIFVLSAAVRACVELRRNRGGS